MKFIVITALALVSSIAMARGGGDPGATSQNTTNVACTNGTHSTSWILVGVNGRENQMWVPARAVCKNGVWIVRHHHFNLAPTPANAPCINGSLSTSFIDDGRTGRSESSHPVQVVCENGVWVRN